jgi:hypothetical protein
MSIIWDHYIWPQDMPLDMTKLHAVEHTWGIRFPQDYKDCVQVNQGKTPEPSVFSFGDSYETVLNELYHFESTPIDSNIVENQKSMSRGDVPDHIYVFAGDPAGNQICFDYRRSDTQPTVLLLHYDGDPKDALVPLADSFTAFLALLH